MRKASVPEHTIFYNEEFRFWTGIFPRDPKHGDFLFDRLWLTGMHATVIFNPADGSLLSYVNIYDDALSEEIFRKHGYPIRRARLVGGKPGDLGAISHWQFVDEKQRFLMQLKYR